MLNALTERLLKSSNVLSLDIGSRYIKAMEMELTGNTPSLQSAVISPVPVKAVENGIIRNKQAVASVIKKTLEKNKIRSKKVQLAAGGPNLVLRWIDMPALPEQEMRNAIKFEARKYLPFPPDHAALDYKILTPKARQQDNTVRLLLIAAPTALVESRFETAELAGLNPIGMDIEPLAVMRALEYARNKDEPAWGGHAKTILVFGSTGTDFYVIKRSDLEFVRRIPIGGRNIVNIIADNVEANINELNECDILKAIRFKGDSIETDELPEQVAPMLQEEFTRLAQEIQRSCSYYQSLFPEGSYEGVLNEAIASGGLMAVEGFSLYLADTLEMPVEVPDPLARLTIRNGESFALTSGNRSSFIVSAGLLLSNN